jgi:hypothetical protein
MSRTEGRIEGIARITEKLQLALPELTSRFMLREDSAMIRDENVFQRLTEGFFVDAYAEAKERGPTFPTSALRHSKNSKVLFERMTHKSQGLGRSRFRSLHVAGRQRYFVASNNRERVRREHRNRCPTV